MDIIGMAIGALGLSFIVIFIWMVSLSVRKKRLEEERKEREEAYRRALERTREEERQERLFKAESGHIPTILYMAKESERGNLREALFWYEKAALLDNINGMHGVVRICKRMRDDMILRSKSQFWEMFIKGLEGDLQAKFETGQSLVFGRGTEVNVVKGLGLIQEAAERKYIEAIIFMGDWCISKDNLSPSPGDSTYWYSKAAKRNSLDGMMKLGINYLRGVGVPVNYEKGCYWLERASEKGHAEAMYHAAEAWVDKGSNGNSIAYIWLYLSAHFGYEPAKILRDKVGSNMGVNSVVGLQALARPLQKKIATGKVNKHSIIRALNKLYKRQIPVPMKGEVLDDSEITENASETLREELAEMDDFDEFELHFPDQTDEDTENRNQELSVKPDFSHTAMDKHS
ncbi:tetratricopeptide repeat protein [Vibrio ziniensis]|uniref:Sel1 repeat family protein n=1 Tax=Vibrio ziniensis TaxID=2711221 RepID=A0A6G7CNG6_9VIBR|nr:tetratricopeptide repeat protein [Vibrio ziniensis]QIH43614.1 sel1 repeat family protein [Vibrio ziniensis]